MHELGTLLLTFFLSFALTLLFEGLISLLFRMRGRNFLLFLLVNLLTNPAAVYLHLLCGSLFPETSVFVWQIPIEVGVVILEGYLYRKYASALRAPWSYAVSANVFSYGAGLILNFIFHI